MIDIIIKKWRSNKLFLKQKLKKKEKNGGYLKFRVRTIQTFLTRENAALRSYQTDGRTNTRALMKIQINYKCRRRFLIKNLVTVFPVPVLCEDLVCMVAFEDISKINRLNSVHSVVLDSLAYYSTFSEREKYIKW